MFERNDMMWHLKILEEKLIFLLDIIQTIIIFWMEKVSFFPNKAQFKYNRKVDFT